MSLQYEHSDNLSKSFNELKEAVLNIEDLKLISPELFLAPFLEAIRSEETTGQITAIALSAVNKFLSYGLIGKCKKQTSSQQYVTIFFLQIQQTQTLSRLYKILLTQLRTHDSLAVTIILTELCCLKLFKCFEL